MGRVLVIRGEPALLDALHAALSPRGHDVESCDGNVEAIQHVRRRATDLVITDATTTAKEDLALAEELRGTRPGTRTILRRPRGGAARHPPRHPDHRADAGGRARRGDRGAARAGLRLLRGLRAARGDRG